MRFVGDDVGALAAGSKVLPSVVLIHYGPTNGVVCQVLFHPGKPSVAAQTKLFFHGEGYCCQSVGGGGGSVGQHWGHLGRQAQTFKILTICKKISSQSFIAAIQLWHLRENDITRNE
jgi:hypothetical protein